MKNAVSRRSAALALFATMALSHGANAEPFVMGAERDWEFLGQGKFRGALVKIENGKAHIRMTLGPEVQTLTRAMTAILCKGLDGRSPREILDLPSDFVTRIVGAELVRVRSQTIYYVLTRIKGVCKAYLDRQRMAEVA